MEKIVLNTYSPEAIGEWIRKARLAAGMTQIEFADAIKVSNIVVSYWEHGKRRPTPEMLQDICETLGYTMNVVIKKVG